MVLLIVGLPSTAFSQDVAAAVETQGKLASALNSVAGYLAGNTIIFSTALFTVLGTGFGTWLQKKIILRRMNSDVSIRGGDKKNSIMLIGLGAVGKTTLAKRIQNNFNGGSVERTDEYTELTAYWRNTETKQNYHLFVSDYKGQSLASQISGFILQQKDLKTNFRFGFVNSLVLVVDIVGKEPGDDGLEPDNLPSIKSLRKKRIEEHVTEWNKTALDAVFGMHNRDSLRYVCLYINKVNRLASTNSNTEKEILQAFKPLIDDLKVRCSYYDEKLKHSVPFAKFACYVDDAHNGPSVAFREDLMTFSVPLSDVATREIGT